jgi:dGTPase
VTDYFLPDQSISDPRLAESRYARIAGPDTRLNDHWTIGGRFTRQRDGQDLKDRRTPTEKDRDRILYSGLFQRLQGVTQIVSPQQDRSSLHNRLSHSLKVASVSRAIAENFIREALDNPSSGLAERIAALGGLDANACEAAGLAHDIGHPPYGHVAEVVMDEWLRYDPDPAKRCENGFEGNAQSFRSVVYLERRIETTYGLELSAVTLAAILKYPWVRAIGDMKRQDKFGAFHTENIALEASRSWFVASDEHDSLEQTLEAAIMDIADDITYAIHDLQDFIAAGVLHPGEMLDLLARVRTNVDDQRDSVREALINPGSRAKMMTTDVESDPIAEVDVSEQQQGVEATATLTRSSRRPFAANPQQIDAFMAKVAKLRQNYSPFFDYDEYSKAIELCIDKIEAWSLESQAPMGSERRRGFGSELIEIAVGDIVLDEPEAPRSWSFAPRVHLNKSAWHWVQVLKDLTKVMVIETSPIGIQQMAETESLRELLSKLDDWCRNPSMREGLPTRLKALLIWSEDNTRKVEALTGFHEDSIRRAVVDYCCSLTDAEAHLVSRYVRGLEVPTALL